MKSSSFNLMVKPVSDTCNLKCEYCFYLGTSESLGYMPSLMPTELLENTTKRYITEAKTPEITFVWQGGEPTLAGLEFFEKAVMFQKKYAGSKVIRNSIQTNGIALNKQWALFFKKNNFLVGISVDGSKKIHDKYRISVNGNGTYDKVKKSITLLNEHGIEYNVLCVVNNINYSKGKAVYNHLKDLGVRFIQFIPIVVFDNRRQLQKLSVPSEGFGIFLLDVFSEWIKSDINYMFILNFESSLSSYKYNQPLICFHNKSCGAPLVVESNGDTFSCDHFVEPAYRIGNIKDSSFQSMINTEKHNKFLKLRNVEHCSRCDFLEMCNGGCPNHIDKTGRNHLCASYKKFFKKSKPLIEFINNNILGE